MIFCRLGILGRTDCRPGSQSANTTTPHGEKRRTGWQLILSMKWDEVLDETKLRMSLFRRRGSAKVRAA